MSLENPPDATEVLIVFNLSRHILLENEMSESAKMECKKIFYQKTRMSEIVLSEFYLSENLYTMLKVQYENYAGSGSDAENAKVG
jgi:hypothetical protein